MVSLRWLCKSTDGIAALELLTVGWIGREEEPGDQRACPPEVWPLPPLQPEVSGEPCMDSGIETGCCQWVVSPTFQGVTCTIHLTYFLITLRNICQIEFLPVFAVWEDSFADFFLEPDCFAFYLDTLPSRDLWKNSPVGIASGWTISIYVCESRKVCTL